MFCQALQETVACLCTVVQHLTHDYVRLIALLKSCNCEFDCYLDPTKLNGVPSESSRLFKSNYTSTQSAGLQNSAYSCSNSVFVGRTFRL